ncbi:MAG: DinB family protein [Chloroflexota bacterium]
MAINAYACALGLMAVVPASVQALVTALPRELLSQRPTADGWSVEDIVAHLLQAETVGIRPRIQQMLVEDNPLLVAAPASTPVRGVETILEELVAARTANLAFLHELTPEQLTRTGRHQKYGIISVREHVIEWAYHDQDHLQQLVTIIQDALYPEIGAFQALYPRSR